MRGFILNMQNPSFGTGSNLLGNTDALKQAMTSRGVDASVLDQVSGSSASFNPQTAGTSIPGSPQPTSQPTPTQPTVPDNDVSTIIKALTKYLGNTQKAQGL